ncbi:BON domain-containing protein [Hahella sp. KA22]|uniref:BON domain-containing protein n=1 Tax=Hahella sp. KA22 TaxID=1628392 RepID=UPI000FDEFD41|nr:BON domain-containing protein [Hahella sp. KA22]AZZ93263.1 BON domain-containing protein [Hahella sp. KA22]QAY56637.1 BON domain-containing protein [Hahella sp. KA22]
MKTPKTFTKKPVYAALIAATLAGAMTVAPAYAAGDKVKKEETVGQQAEEMTQDAKKYFKDGWTEGKIETAILFNENLSTFEIDASVNGSNATLVGTVSSEVEKELAEQIALSVEGVKDVDNQLQVASTPAKKENAENESFKSSVADATITAKVKMKLLANESVAGLDIDVDTEGRVVTLNGAVDSEAEKDLAEKLASNVDDVDSVENKLMIN